MPPAVWEVCLTSNTTNPWVGQSVNLTIEYFVPNATLIPTAVTFLVEVVPPLPALNPVGTLVTGVQVVRQLDNHYSVDFTTVLGATYFIQYSADGVTWKTVRPALTGTGGRLVWLDNGPPKTESDSAGVTGRFYRVMRVAS